MTEEAVAAAQIRDYSGLRGIVTEDMEKRGQI